MTRRRQPHSDYEDQHSQQNIAGAEVPKQQQDQYVLERKKVNMATTY